MVLQPLPGVTSVSLLGRLQEAQRTLQNARATGHYAADRLNAYARWANEQAAMLHRAVTPASLDLLITSPRYYLLQQVDPSTHGSLNTLVDLEIDRCLAVFEQGINELDRFTRSWPEGRSLVVADTNVFCHHPAFFQDVDWNLASQARMAGTVMIIPMVVIDELDNLKDRGAGKVTRGSNEEVRDRARRTLRKIDDLFENPDWMAPLQRDRFPKAGRVDCRLFLDPLDHARFPANDAELVSRARHIQDLTGQKVTLVSFDTGIGLRARAAGLTACKPPADPVDDEGRVR